MSNPEEFIGGPAFIDPVQAEAVLCERGLVIARATQEARIELDIKLGRFLPTGFAWLIATDDDPVRQVFSAYGLMPTGQVVETVRPLAVVAVNNDWSVDAHLRRMRACHPQEFTVFRPQDEKALATGHNLLSLLISKHKLVI